jgi:hypothetical protein
MMITGSGAYELRYLLTDKCTTALEFLILMSAFGSSSPNPKLAGATSHCRTSWWMHCASTGRSARVEDETRRRKTAG